MNSRVTFFIAEVCLLAGSVRNAYHTKYRSSYLINDQPLSCETVRKGVFGAGAAFVFFTAIVSQFYYVSYSKARGGAGPYCGEAGVGMAAYKWSMSLLISWHNPSIFLIQIYSCWIEFLIFTVSSSSHNILISNFSWRNIVNNTVFCFFNAVSINFPCTFRLICVHVCNTSLLFGSCGALHHFATFKIYLIDY